MTAPHDLLLTGQLNETETTLAVFSRAQGVQSPVMMATFPSRDYASLPAVVCAFLDRTDLRPARASFSVAGPVAPGRATVSGLPWVIRGEAVAAAIDAARVDLLGEGLALAHAVPHLGPADLHPLNLEEAVPGGPIAVLAPGPGLSEAYLTRAGSDYQAHPSEGGHAAFAPTTEAEMGLLAHLRCRSEYVSYAQVCSRAGISQIYTYLKESGCAPEPDWLAARLATAPDPATLILKTALSGQVELCRLTLNMFIAILGAEAGHLALKVLASGGVYLGGDLMPRLLPALQAGEFLPAFRGIGRMRSLLAWMPVYVILNPRAALLGAARYGLSP